MHEPYVVRKGFFASLVTGFFSLLTVCVVCGSGLGFYAINVFDRKTTAILTPTLDTARQLLVNWRTSLPPALADAVDDRRAPEYRDSLEIKTRVVDGHSDRKQVVIEVKNNGSETVSILAARILSLDAGGNPIQSKTEYFATPLTLDHHDWRGPLLPGSTRVVSWQTMARQERGIERVTVELTDVRVWDPSLKTKTRTDSDAPATASR